MKFRSWMRFLPILLLFVGLVIFFYLRLYNYLNLQALKEHRIFLLAYVQKHFITAVVLFILIYTFLTAISAPGAFLLTIIGGFLFGPVWGTLFVLIAATLGASIIFLAAKTALHDFLLSRISVWFKKLAVGFKVNAVSYLLFLRLVPLFPFWLINIVPAFFGVSLRVFVITTFIGIMPGTFVYIMLGNGIGVIFDQGKIPDSGIIFKPEIFIPIIGLAVLALVPVVYKRIRKHDGKAEC